MRSNFGRNERQNDAGPRSGLVKGDVPMGKESGGRAEDWITFYHSIKKM